MSNNTEIREKIMGLLDDNSGNIPDGFYLEMCNLLQKFKFTDTNVNDTNHEAFARRVDTLLARQNDYGHDERVIDHDAMARDFQRMVDAGYLDDTDSEEEEVVAPRSRTRTVHTVRSPPRISVVRTVHTVRSGYTSAGPDFYFNDMPISNSHPHQPPPQVHVQASTRGPARVPDRILNPDTGRMVLRNGATGKRVLRANAHS